MKLEPCYLIKKMLKDSNMTNRELAKKMNVLEVSVSRWVNGTRQPSFKTFMKIMEVCGYRLAIKKV